MKKFLGFQLCNRDGINIQGDWNDPTNLASFEIMSTETAIDVISNLDSAKFLLIAIFEGDIEDYSIV